VSSDGWNGILQKGNFQTPRTLGEMSIHPTQKTSQTSQDSSQAAKAQQSTTSR
jgi:hypothetical protein